jgi:hypothetical protein
LLLLTFGFHSFPYISAPTLQISHIKASSLFHLYTTHT